MEVKSELYEETDFNSVSISNGSESHCSVMNLKVKLKNYFFYSDVISKFRFSMPSEDDENRVALQHDNDHDIIVKRKINEFLEIGMKIILK